MSSIVDMVILCPGTGAEDGLAALKAWCIEHAETGDFFKEAPVHGHAGGRKVFCTRVFALAGNYFPWRELLDAFPTFPWGSYVAETTMLAVLHENEDAWTVVSGSGVRKTLSRYEMEGI